MPGGYIGVSIFLCLPSIEKAAPSHATPRQDGGGINRPAQDRTASCAFIALSCWSACSPNWGAMDWRRPLTWHVLVQTPSHFWRCFELFNLALQLGHVGQ